MTRITLLGTGGGRHATIYQTRSTGGFVLDDGVRIHADPGPSALVNMKTLGMDPADTDHILISHCHPDHYSDAETLIEGMCRGCSEKRGTVIGSESVLKGIDGVGPCISAYHRGLPEKCVIVRPGDSIDLGKVHLKITRSDHSDPTTVGFMFRTNNGVISYVSDTGYSDEIADQYLDSRLLMLPVTTPDEKRISYHLCTQDAIRFVERIRPEIALFVHMGIYMIKMDPDVQAKRVSDATGCNVIAGRDLMTIDVGKEIAIKDHIIKI